jgi:CIC family chloride channel protein
VVLSAISSVVVVRWFLGAEPLFRIPAVGLANPSELLAYVILGIIGGLAATLFARGIGYFRPRLRRWPRWTQYLQPAVAGLIIGLIGYFGAPQVMGAGYEYVDQAMHDQFTWKMLALLAGVKVLATILSFVSGTPGGMFAPTLFIGAMLGGAVGGVERIFYPHLTGSTATYALVGMGVLFAGFLRSPMTSVFMVLELSGNYSIIVPVIIANTLAYLISRALQPVPIFDLLTRQDGLVLPSLEEQREQTVLRIEDAMKPASVPVLNAGGTVEQAFRRIEDSKAEVFLVRMSPSGWSSVSKDGLKRLFGEGKGETSLGSNLTIKQLPILYPDLPLDIALRYVQDFSMSRSQSRRLPQTGRRDHPRRRL